MSRVDISDPKVHEDALVTRQECADYLRITTTSWDRLVAVGKAPPKVTPDGVWPRWRAGDIREWMLGRANAQEGATKKE